MAKVTGKNLSLNPEEITLLSEGKEYEIIPNDNGIFLMIDKKRLEKNEGKQVCVNVPINSTPTSTKKPMEELNEEKKQVLQLIRNAKLSDLVEGKFENTLNENQKKALLQLVTTSQVFVFKLNDTYKKGVYRVKEEEIIEKHREKKESENINAKEKQWNEYNLDQDGFLIIKGKESAAKASYEYEKEIREKTLRGIKSFDGNYYLIQTNLLEAYTKKIIQALENKNTQNTEEIAKTLDTSKTLASILCEFLKEEGELLERKKGTYTYIK